MRMAAISIGSSILCYVAFLTLPDKRLVLLTLIPMLTIFNLFVAPTYALMQRLVPDDMRATVMAMIMLFYNFIGMGLGPQIVGIISDSLAPSVGADSLRYAMLIMSFMAVWAAYHLWRVSQTVEQDLLETTRGRRYPSAPQIAGQKPLPTVR